MARLVGINSPLKKMTEISRYGNEVLNSLEPVQAPQRQPHDWTLPERQWTKEKTESVIAKINADKADIDRDLQLERDKLGYGYEVMEWKKNYKPPVPMGIGLPEDLTVPETKITVEPGTPKVPQGGIDSVNYETSTVKLRDKARNNVKAEFKPEVVMTTYFPKITLPEKGRTMVETQFSMTSTILTNAVLAGDTKKIESIITSFPGTVNKSLSDLGLPEMSYKDMDLMQTSLKKLRDTVINKRTYYYQKIGLNPDGTRYIPPNPDTSYDGGWTSEGGTPNAEGQTYSYQTTAASFGNHKRSSRLKELYKDLITNKHFDQTTASGRGATAVAMMIAAGEVSTWIESGGSTNLYTGLGGAYTDMQGWAQVYRSVHGAHNINTKEKYLDFVGGWLDGSKPQPDSSSTVNSGRFQNDVCNGKIKNGDQLLKAVQGSYTLMSWHGLHKTGGGDARIRERNTHNEAYQYLASACGTAKPQQQQQPKTKAPVTATAPKGKVDWGRYKDQEVIFSDRDFQGAKEGFIYPVPGGKIHKDPRQNGHRGVDIFAPTGTKVLSPWSGTIVYAMSGGTRNTEDSDEKTPGYQAQHSIKIKLDRPVTVNGRKVAFIYLTHLSKLGNLKKGQRVPAGAYLGNVGTAGGHPHLHIGLGATSNFADPNPYGYVESVELLNQLRN